MAKLLSDAALQAEYRNAVWWIDEAGQVSVPTMCRLFRAAERNGARIVLSGDTRQHGPVERGEALRLLRDEAKVPFALVEEIQRQKGMYKAAVHDCSQGKIREALEKFDAMKAIREITTAERYKELAREYLEAIRDGVSAAVISPTHSECRRVTDVIRADLKAAGLLRRERTVRVLRSLDMGGAERADVREYRPGFVIEFIKWTKGFKPSERMTVVEMLPADRHVIVVERPDGTRRELDVGRLAGCFRVYEWMDLPVCQGERLRITKNGKTWNGRYELDNG